MAHHKHLINGNYFIVIALTTLPPSIVLGTQWVLDKYLPKEWMKGLVVVQAGGRESGQRERRCNGPGAGAAC